MFLGREKILLSPGEKKKRNQNWASLISNTGKKFAESKV